MLKCSTLSIPAQFFVSLADCERPSPGPALVTVQERINLPPRYSVVVELTP